MSRKRYRRQLLHPVQNGPKPRYIYVTGDTLEQIAAFRSHFDQLRGAIKHGLRTAEDVEAEIAKYEARREPVPLSKLAAKYMDPPDRLAPKTRANVQTFLRAAGRRLAHQDYRALTAPVVKAWVDDLQGKGLSLGYVQLQWRILRSIIGHALERGVIAACPWGIWSPKIRGNRRKNDGEAARDVGELALLLDTARRIDEERRRVGSKSHGGAAGGRAFLLEPRIAIAAFLGLHQGELAGLRWNDLDVEHGLVRIARQYDEQPLKTHARAAHLRVLPELFEIFFLQALDLEARGLFAPDGPVFPCPSRSTSDIARPYRAGGCVLETRELRAGVVRAGLPNPEGWTTTSLRRTFATLEDLGAGGDLVALAERTRHASVSSLLRYLRGRRRGPAEPGFSLAGIRPTRLGAGAQLPLLPAAGGRTK